MMNISAIHGVGDPIGATGLAFSSTGDASLQPRGEFTDPAVLSRYRTAPTAVTPDTGSR